MIDFLDILHYIVYRFYRRHMESDEMSMLRACNIYLFLTFAIIAEIIYFVCLFLDIPLFVNKTFAWGYIILWAIFEYIAYFRNGQYKEIFRNFARQSDDAIMKEKFRKAKIFNYTLFAIDIILLCIIDYCNHHK